MGRRRLSAIIRSDNVEGILKLRETDFGILHERFGDDYSQPDAADREPVFWPEGSDQSAPDEAYVQGDAPDCAEQILAA